MSNSDHSDADPDLEEQAATPTESESGAAVDVAIVPPAAAPEPEPAKPQARRRQPARPRTERPKAEPTTPQIDQSDPEAHYTVSLWAGLENYECSDCPWSTLDKDFIQNHVWEKHIMPFAIAEVPKEELQPDTEEA